MSDRCQSCCMPLPAEPRGLGTNADGSSNPDYCSFCFQNGRFTDGFSSADEMMRYVRAKLRQKGHNVFMAWFYARKVPSLKRWRH